MTNLIAVFDTTYETLKAEDYFHEAKCSFKPILKPRKIGSSCRMALQFNAADLARAKEAVANCNFKFKGFFCQSDDGWQRLE